MNNFETYFRDNRVLLNGDEPVEGHFERFTARLESRYGKTRRLTFATVLKAAAILLLVTISSLWTYQQLDNILSRKEVSLGEISQEYRDVEIYYTGMVSTKYSEIDHFSFPGDSIQKKILRKELSDMDSIYASLKRELGANPDNERIIHAMIDHFEMKLEIMNQIVEQLKQLNDQKLINKTNHESTDV